MDTCLCEKKLEIKKSIGGEHEIFIIEINFELFCSFLTYSCINYTTKYKCKGRIHTYLDERIIKETPHCHKPFEIKSDQKRSVARSLAIE